MPQPGMSEDLEAILGGGEDLGTLDALSLLEALTKVAIRSGPVTGLQRLGELGGELFRIALGRSEVAPSPKDWRFTNRAWREHPLYKRLCQAYVAWSETANRLVDDAALDWRSEQRARLATSLLTSALAPTNQLLLNPDALERAYETAGRSLVQGLRNLGLDVVHNGGMPRSVAPGAYEVGRNLAVTPGSVVLRNEVCELLQYRPTTEEVRERPVLVVPPQINKYYVMDLSPGRSFIEYAVSRGFQMFAVSWRNPTKEQGHWDLGTYLDALDEALGAATDITGAQVNPLGVCAGGLTAASLLARHASRGDDVATSASFAVTQLDYTVPSLIGMFATDTIVSGALRSSERAGVLRPNVLGTLFASLRPNDLIWNYWVRNNLMGEDPPSFDVMAWNADGTALPARLHAQFLDVFLYNRLARAELRVGVDTIDLRKVPCDIFVMGARTDHLVPWEACYANTQLFGGEPEFVLSSSGHIQSLVNPPGSPRMTVTTGGTPDPDPARWLLGATETPGVWWERWADWQEQRSGHLRRSPKRLGSKAHRELGPAPGTYVCNA